MHAVGSMAACSMCGQLIREFKGHLSGRCGWLDDIDEMLVRLKRIAQEQKYMYSRDSLLTTRWSMEARVASYSIVFFPKSWAWDV